MESVGITRAEVQEEIKAIVTQTKDHNAVKMAIQQWLAQKQASPLDTRQILNDLTSYQEYLDLLN